MYSSCVFDPTVHLIDDPSCLAHHLDGLRSPHRTYYVLEDRCPRTRGRGKVKLCKNEEEEKNKDVKKLKKQPKELISVFMFHFTSKKI